MPGLFRSLILSTLISFALCYSSGILTPPTIAPLWVPNIDANALYCFTVTTSAQQGDVYSVNTTDVHAVTGNYTVAFIKSNPTDLTCKLPQPYTQDPTLVYVQGDVGQTRIEVRL